MTQKYQILLLETLKFALVLSASLFSPHSLDAQQKSTLGWVEKVKILPENMVLHAKLDTGADYSSLNATDIEEYEKDGRKWVKFVVTNRYGDRVHIDRNVVRTATIKRHAAKSQKRQVIRLGLCAGSVYMEADVNLVDRTNYDFQMLIGRSFLAGNVVIDPAISYTTEPNCKRGSAQ